MMVIQRKNFSSIWFVPYVLLFTLFIGTGFSQLRWQRVYGGPGGESGYCVDQTTDGGYIVVGISNSYGNGDQVYLIKTDSLGDTLWAKIYGGAANDIGTCVRQTADGGYIIVGSTQSFGNGYDDIYLIKTDSLGNMIWFNTYGDTLYDQGWSVQQTVDGGYIITGESSWEGCLIKTDTMGDTMWVKHYGGFLGFSVQQTTDHGYVITGYNGGSAAVGLIRTDSLGDTIWTKIYRPGTIDNVGKFVQQTFDDGYMIVGTAQTSMHTMNVMFIKVDSLGENPVYGLYGPTGYDAYSFGESGQQTNDSGYIIVGSNWPNSQVYLIKIDSLGNVEWENYFGGGDDDGGSSVQQTQDRGYIIAGISSSYGNSSQIYLIKTDEYGCGMIEENRNSSHPLYTIRATAFPNPFVSFAKVIGYEKEKFILYDISGRQVGSYWGDRIGFGLPAGVYFLMSEDKSFKPVRVVKVR